MMMTRNILRSGSQLGCRGTLRWRVKVLAIIYMDAAKYYKKHAKVLRDKKKVRNHWFKEKTLKSGNILLGI